MNALIAEIIELDTAVNAFYTKLRNPVPAPPASEAELARLDDYFRGQGLATPPSLREALASFNGVEHLFDEDLGLLPVDDIVMNRIVPDSEVVEAFPTATQVIIGGGNTPAFVGLDLDEVGPEGEIGVVDVYENLFARRAPSLRAYLETIRDTLKENLESQQRDREGLPDN